MVGTQLAQEGEAVTGKISRLIRDATTTTSEAVQPLAALEDEVVPVASMQDEQEELEQACVLFARAAPSSPRASQALVRFLDLYMSPPSDCRAYIS